MILTVTLNPAVDRTIYLNNLTVGQVNRVIGSRQDAGGKGINVSKSITALGGKSIAFAVLGGQNGEYIARNVAARGIELTEFRIDGETRQNIKIVDLSNDAYTDINEPGPELNGGSSERIQEAILSRLTAGTVLVLSGSAAPGIAPDIYRRLSEEAARRGCPVILDADDRLLAEALKGRPRLVKPNIHELEALVGRTLNGFAEIVEAAFGILSEGAGAVVVSMGKEGAIWVDRQQAFHIESMNVTVKSTVGAGDAMVAALALGLETGLEPEETMRLAAASSAASVKAEGSDCGTVGENLIEASKHLKITRLGGRP